MITDEQNGNSCRANYNPFALPNCKSTLFGFCQECDAEYKIAFSKNIALTNVESFARLLQKEGADNMPPRSQSNYYTPTSWASYCVRNCPDGTKEERQWEGKTVCVPTCPEGEQLHMLEGCTKCPLECRNTCEIFTLKCPSLT